MHKVTFFPLGNADCYRIDLHNGKKILTDYANVKDTEDDEDLRIDLAAALREDLDEAHRNEYDVVAFTHADDDHIHGFSDFFYLEHAKKYQDDSRARINVLWVPAAVITESSLKDEARVLQAEARHRIKVGKGLRVFSRPEHLKDWFDSEKISLESRRVLITDAGQICPEFTLGTDGIEFFVHSPFATRQEGQLIDRNDAALVTHATFLIGSRTTRMMLGSDCEHEAWADIVRITEYKSRLDRLDWDIFKIAHHCSYTALSAEMGEEKTKPDAEVERLFKRGQQKGILVATCKPIPSDDSDDQPPHRQAANYYREIAKGLAGDFKVTMEYPRESRPEPLVIQIDDFGATLKKLTVASGASVLTRPAPRAGR